VQKNIEPQRAPRRFALHRESNTHKEDKRRSALEEKLHSFMVFLILFSLSSLCAKNSETLGFAPLFPTYELINQAM